MIPSVKQLLASGIDLQMSVVREDFYVGWHSARLSLRIAFGKESNLALIVSAAGAKFQT